MAHDAMVRQWPVALAICWVVPAAEAGVGGGGGVAFPWRGGGVAFPGRGGAEARRLGWRVRVEVRLAWRVADPGGLDCGCARGARAQQLELSGG